MSTAAAIQKRTTKSFVGQNNYASVRAFTKYMLPSLETTQPLDGSHLYTLTKVFPVSHRLECDAKKKPKKRKKTRTPDALESVGKKSNRDTNIDICRRVYIRVVAKSTETEHCSDSFAQSTKHFCVCCILRTVWVIVLVSCVCKPSRAVCSTVYCGVCSIYL